MTNNDLVYLAWQAPVSKGWHVVGALTTVSGAREAFEFHYTKGALASDSFTPFSGMNDLNKSYISDKLFPLFHNRLLSQKRPEYPKLIRWLGLSESEATPLNILARSGGTRETDNLQMFRRIKIDESGYLKHYFFLHGINYLDSSATNRIDRLEQGERLSFCKDIQNTYDSQAVLVRAKNPAEIIGYCPRYLAQDINELLEHSEYLHVSVETISSDAPINYRLMCKVEGKLQSGGFDGFPKQDEYQLTI